MFKVDKTKSKVKSKIGNSKKYLRVGNGTVLDRLYAHRDIVVKVALIGQVGVVDGQARAGQGQEKPNTADKGVSCGHAVHSGSGKSIAQ